MAILPRRLLALGGAMALAGAGFAYMDTNAVSASSAGEGAAAVTGYTVSNIQWTADNASDIGDGPMPYESAADVVPYYMTGLEFTLTSKATSAPANGQPASLNVALQTDINGTIGYTQIASSKTGGYHTCSISGWVTNGNGQGTGTVKCGLIIRADQIPPIADVIGIDVEAHQGPTYPVQT